MCGISGIIRLDGAPVQAAVLDGMNERLAHRGPDASGIWISEDGSAGFAHRRLAIIDLSADGTQPMRSADGRYVITFNGEIYNYLELRAELEGAGVRFRTATDVEVLLNIFILKGERCLQELDGMFSFAVYDSKERSLFCARDRFGEKPFFYRSTSSSLAFASEVKALLAEGGTASLTAVQRYLDTGSQSPPSGETFFEGVLSLPPAHFLTLKSGRLKVARYWSLDLSKRLRYSRDSEYPERFLALFNTSVARRLRSGVPVGSSLSGGLDSSSIVSAVAAGGKAGPVTTFSARFGGDPKDEGAWIDRVVRHTGARNFQVQPSVTGFLEELRTLTYHLEVPLGGFSNYAQWCVMRLAHQHGTKVLLDGQGADEALGGYSPYRQHFLWDLYASGRFGDFRAELQAYRSSYGSPLRLGSLYLAAPLLRLFRIFKGFPQARTARETMLADLTLGLPTLLQYADRTSMAFSLEVRLVFLSHELVEFLFSLPNEALYRGASTKHVLRQAMAGMLDEEVRTRKDKLQFAPSEAFLDADPRFAAQVDSAKDRVLRRGLRPSVARQRNLYAAEFLDVFRS